MTTITLTRLTYQWLQNKARDRASTPDQVADDLLRQQLSPKHAHVEVMEGAAGAEAIIKGTRVPVSMVIGYLRMGETPDSLVRNILPHLTLAQIHDALSYYYDHRSEIEQALTDNTEARGQAYLRQRLGAQNYLRLTGSEILS